MSDLYIVATMTSRDDKVEALRNVLRPATEAFRQEEGCLAYTLLEDQKRPGRFMTYERWRDAAALEAHMSSPTMEKLKPLLPDLLGEPLKQDFLDALLIL
jgi:quinol monooxygenase YgiN